MNELTSKESDVLTQLDIKSIYKSLKSGGDNKTLLIEDETGANQMINVLSNNQATHHMATEWREARFERYIFFDGESWYAVDHTTGECWLEAFETFQEALFWLANNSYTPEEVRSANKSAPEVRHATT